MQDQHKFIFCFSSSPLPLLPPPLTLLELDGFTSLKSSPYFPPLGQNPKNDIRAWTSNW
jgi:hypothetical protein